MSYDVVALNPGAVSDVSEASPPLLSIIEAAMRARVSVELIRSFALRCPKPKEKRKLPYQLVADEEFFLAKDIDDYFLYLSEPWPKPPSGRRPHIPEAIMLFIARESHFMCAICGKTSKCEVAHIDPVYRTLNNSPDNLLYLCPNHHTQFDSVEKDNALTVDQIRSVKETKQQATVRMLRFEHNLRLSLARAQLQVEEIRSRVEQLPEESDTDSLIAELTTVEIAIRKLKNAADKASRKDQPVDESDIEATLYGDDDIF